MLLQQQPVFLNHDQTRVELTKMILQIRLASRYFQEERIKGWKSEWMNEWINVWMRDWETKEKSCAKVCINWKQWEPTGKSELDWIFLSLFLFHLILYSYI